MGQVGITNPFTKIPEDQYHEYGIPGAYPTGIGAFGDASDPCDQANFVGPLSAEQARVCRGQGYTFDQGTAMVNSAFNAGRKAGPASVKNRGGGFDISTHLNASPLGIPNWVLYAGGGLGLLVLIGSK